MKKKVYKIDVQVGRVKDGVYNHRDHHVHIELKNHRDHYLHIEFNNHREHHIHIEYM